MAKKHGKAREQAVRLRKESCWAVQIGSRPKHQPYLMIAGSGNFTPHLFNSEADAEGARLDVPDPKDAFVVRVYVAWRSRRSNQRKAKESRP